MKFPLMSLKSLMSLMLLTEVINKTSELLTLLMRFSIQTAEIRIKNLTFATHL
jgi:hypothetical protein